MQRVIPEKKENSDFEKDFFKLMNNSVFGKTMENARNHRDIKLVTSGKGRNKLAIEMNKINVKINMPVYLHLSILDVRKIPMYKYCYDCLKSKYVKKDQTMLH